MTTLITAAKETRVTIGERVITGTQGLGRFGRIYHTTENDVLYKQVKCKILVILVMEQIV